jgi:hypothetical protein
MRPAFPQELRREAKLLLTQRRFHDALGYLRMLEDLVPDERWAFSSDPLARAQLGRVEQPATSRHSVRYGKILFLQRCRKTRLRRSFLFGLVA